MARRYTHILVQAHGGADSCLWDMSEGWASGEIYPETLGLSPALVRRIEAYTKVTNAGTLLAVEGVEVVETDDEIANHLAEGFYIAGDLQRELGHRIVVLYFRNLETPEVPFARTGDGDAFRSADRNEADAKGSKSRFGPLRRPKSGG